VHFLTFVVHLKHTTKFGFLVVNPDKQARPTCATRARIRAPFDSQIISPKHKIIQHH
jgi:hypothetical protein